MQSERPHAQRNAFQLTILVDNPSNLIIRKPNLRCHRWADFVTKLEDFPKSFLRISKWPSPTEKMRPCLLISDEYKKVKLTNTFYPMKKNSLYLFSSFSFSLIFFSMHLLFLSGEGWINRSQRIGNQSTYVLHTCILLKQEIICV